MKLLFSCNSRYTTTNTWEKICAKVCKQYSENYESCYEECASVLEDCDDDETCISRTLSDILGKNIYFDWTEKGFRIEVCEEKEISLDD